MRGLAVRPIIDSVASGMNPNRLACAAHEVGHGVAFQGAGFPVRSMRIHPGHPSDGWAVCDHVQALASRVIERRDEA